MGSKWKKVKIALGMNLCLYVPKTLEDSSSSSLGNNGDNNTPERLSDAALLSSANWALTSSMPNTPNSSSHALKLSKSSSKSSKHTCSICLTKMKQGGGHAIFTAECSHSFHFHCITSNVNHGNQICPICRSKWMEIPVQGPSFLEPPQNEAVMTSVRRLPPPRRGRDLTRRHVVPLCQPPEPDIFDDDESLGDGETSSLAASDNDIASRTIEIKTYPEFSAAPRARSYDDFAVLVHLKAAAAAARRQGMCQATRCAPVDLVTVLDISGSMAGTKLALLKRAMGFVIQNLGSNDRLSVIAFSSTAHRVFPLRRMTDAGRQQALQDVNSLVANGGTNIAEGLRKGAKVMEDRRGRNPVASIILLSDGQDTYNRAQPNYRHLLPNSINGDNSAGLFQIPVHTFGFGADHDASSMHSISEFSGGTFSFIETESIIQDALAQCIGGLLSVVAQEVQVAVECSSPGVRVRAVKAGSYGSRVAADGRTAFVSVGDMYADEERDFLLSVQFPNEESSAIRTPLLWVKCVYKDPTSKETASTESEEVSVERPESGRSSQMSMEVDRQRNRLRAADAMVQAGAVAEQRDLAGAIAVLEGCREALAGSASGRGKDRLCMALDAELREMQERMASRNVYEASGRAYILSGLSSHSWQRATARGAGDGSSLVWQGYYQTPSMAEMLTRSQAALLGSPTAHRLLQPLLQPKPR